ncbi:unnamed protein product [Phytomonas sp. EM1]|nr:unnamed protein product [Phytomonas sp. EM1]|eukprot:CCW64147.1 unnamed protein product [Phytomonas sp. isolate EM1]
MTNHLSWRHPHEGFAPQEFAAFNAHVVRRLVARLWGEGGAPPRQTKRNPSKLHETNHQGGDKEALDVATEVGVISPHSTGFSSSISPPSPPPFQLLLLVDVANMELNSSPAVLELLESPEAKRFFSSMPIAFGMIHEIFIPHTAKTPHGFFRLAQLHPWSEMFTYYAVSRLESGDMEISSLIGALRIETDAHARRRGKIAATASLEESRSRAVSPRLPPMVILTMDKHLKTSLIEHYGDGGGDERLFNTTVDASEFESVNGAIPRLQHQSEVRLYVPRALSAFQIMRTLRLLQKGMSV